jgi:predicted nucleotidyltransferase
MLANNQLLESITRVCQALNQHEVDYLLVGGSAVAYYGYFRHSITMAGMPADRPDVDIWYSSTYANYFKLLDALMVLGQDVTAYKSERAPDPKKSFFRYEFDLFTLDLLPAIKSGMNFGAAFSRREVIKLGGVAIPFMDFEDLIIDKQATARPKDLDDIAHLRGNTEES